MSVLPTVAPRDQASPARPGARASAWTAVVCLIAAVVAAPGSGDLLGVTAFARILEGEVELRDGESWRLRQPGDTVPADAELRTAGSRARLTTSAGDLRLADGTAIVTGRGADVTLLRGSILLEVTDAVAVGIAAAQARGRGTWRADVGAASRVAVYRGRATVADGVTEVGVARYQQVGLRDGAVVGLARPVHYLATDAWDRELLVDAFAVDRLVAGTAVSLRARYGDEPQAEPFYGAFGPAAVAARAGELASVVRGERFGPPAEVLVGVAVADALAVEVGLAADGAVDRVVLLRRAGATWGLVLVHHGLGADALRAALDRLLTSGLEAGAEPDDAASGEGAPRMSDEGTQGTAADEGTGADEPPVAAAGDDPSPTPRGAGDDTGGDPGGSEGGGPLLDDLVPSTDQVTDEAGGGLEDLLDDAGDLLPGGETFPLSTG